MLKTDFLGLNYHPNPATNTDEVDAEKYFNENYFTIDANSKSVNEQLNKQIRKVEQLQTENNELKAQIPERQCRRQQRTYRRQFELRNEMESEGWT